jgi:hypothetical protein
MKLINYYLTDYLKVKKNSKILLLKGRKLDYKK